MQSSYVNNTPIEEQNILATEPRFHVYLTSGEAQRLK